MKKKLDGFYYYDILAKKDHILRSDLDGFMQDGWLDGDDGLNDSPEAVALYNEIYEKIAEYLVKFNKDLQ